MIEQADLAFDARMHKDPRRDDDKRSEYARDKARIVHSAAFRRLQGKTQVMGVGEGDFHRTRLTHSIEVAQIGEGLLLTLRDSYKADEEVSQWLPERDLLEAACFAHDLGHPPFGHGGERALQACLLGKGGFEGNAQTLRILVKLEKLRIKQGINPTRRTALATLKYPVAYARYDEATHKVRPPKCYYDTEDSVVRWLLAPFSEGDQRMLAVLDAKGKPLHRSFDASIMEQADDIAYAVHDLEDIVARRMVSRQEMESRVDDIFPESQIGGSKGMRHDEFVKELYDCGSARRKQMIGKLVNLFVTETKVDRQADFSHPLLRFRVTLDANVKYLLERLKSVTYSLVVEQAGVQQLERRGQRVVTALYNEISSDPSRLIPKSAWADLDSSDSEQRRVCDYVAGMTDPYAERIYGRLFTPGIGSSHDEL